MLSQTELDHFHREGYLLKENVFSADECRAVLDAIAEIIAAAIAQLKTDGWTGNDFPDEPVECRLAKIYQNDLEAGKKILHAIQGAGGGGYHGPAMLAAIRNENLLAIMQDLVGESIVGSSVYRIRPKIPGMARGEVPWHQDSGYFMAHCDQHLVVTAWVALVDATIENGCMYVLPRQHTESILEHKRGGHAGFLVVDDERLNQREHEKVCAAVPAGSVVLMTNLTPHVSYSNTSDHIRWSLDLRYQGGEVPNNVGETPEDVTEDRPEVTMACYPPEADFVLKDPSDPSSEVTDPEVFADIREKFDFSRAAQRGAQRWELLQESN